MTEVFLGIGSNRNRYQNIAAGVVDLRAMFGKVELSPVFESEAIGFSGQPFLNLVARVSTDLSLQRLFEQLRALEYRYGRQDNTRKCSDKGLDIDILTYGDDVGIFDEVELPRPEILYNAFVLWPISLLAPNKVHPVAAKTYQQLWSEYQGNQLLWPVRFCWS